MIDLSKVFGKYPDDPANSTLKFPALDVFGNEYQRPPLITRYVDEQRFVVVPPGAPTDLVTEQIEKLLEGEKALKAVLPEPSVESPVPTPAPAPRRKGSDE